MSRDSGHGSHIPHKIHVRMFPQATTRDLKQLIIPEYHMGVYHKVGYNANGRTSIFDVSHDYVKNVVPERKQCFSIRCHISDIDIDKLSFKNPSQDKLSPATPSNAPLCIRYSRCYIRFHKWFEL